MSTALFASKRRKLVKKEVKREKRRLVKAYWSSITAMCSLVLMGTPAFAASGGTI